jgi:pimeloyl-ACP methyl ester carboxylesterase
MKAHTIYVGGMATRYYTLGTGAPVVLLHGGAPGSRYLAYGARIWSRTMAQLAAAFDVIALDRPGHGETAAPLSDDAYTLDHEAAHTAAFLMALGTGPFHIVGHGHGGYVACRLAIDHPELVRSCTIVDSSALAPGASRQYRLADAPAPLRSRESQRWVLEAHSLHSQPVVDAWLDQAVEHAQFACYRSAVAAMEERGVEDRVFAPALARGRIAVFRHLVNSGLTMPTFVIWGKDDPIAPLENARLLYEALARKQRNTEMRVINDAGHFVFLEQPAAFVRALHAFLEASSPIASTAGP